MTQEELTKASRELAEKAGITVAAAVSILTHNVIEETKDDLQE